MRRSIRLLIGLTSLCAVAFGCDPGYYLLDGDCYKCPAGFYCTADKVLKCGKGYYSDFGQDSCTQCPEGFKCSKTYEIPVHCPENTYSFAGSTECAACPAGYYCYKGVIHSCVDGEYCPGGKWHYDCSAGHDCIGAVLQQACSDGQYVNSSTKNCTDCPAGKFCPNKNFSVGSFDCPRGYYSLGNSINCTVCPEGHACLASDSAPVPCPDGYYAPERSEYCVQCPKGYKCPHDNRSAPIRCADDEYAPAGSMMCKKCYNETSCYDGDLHECGSGFYSEDGVCKKCPAGKACASGMVIDCPSGTYSAPGSDNCTLSSEGHYVPSGNSVELPCPSGTYQPFQGQESCVPCNGSGCSTNGSTSCTRCYAGQYFNGLDDCEMCPAGFFCPDPSTPTVEPCPPGFYSNEGSQSCTLCEAGYYCGNGAQMTECPDGYYSVHGAQRCIKCPPGYECRTTMKTIIGVIKCPMGYYVKENKCTACPEGSMCPHPEVDPMECANGTYASHKGMSECMPCPHGSYCSATAILGKCGAGNHSYLYEGSCEPCPQNYACDNQIMEVCPLGFYANNVSSECSPCSNQSCMRSIPIDCPNNRYANASTPICHLPPPGYYCNLNVPKKCGINTYAPHEGLTACFNCSDGTYAPEGSDQCYPCPGGYSCSGRTRDPCPEGTYSTDNNNTCRQGIEGFVYYRATGFAMPPLQMAPRGIYSVKYSSSYVFMYRCPAGKYNTKPGSHLLADCKECPKGFYCPEATGDPLLYECPQGYYCPAASALPTPCPVNTFNFEKGSDIVSRCISCRPGYYCPLGTSNPEPCPLGNFCPGGEKLVCPDGTFSGERTGLQTFDECLLCPAGYYCPAGTPHPIPAPTGYYIPLMGMSSLNNSMKCPPSHPCTTTGLSVYKGANCELGYYCPGGTSNSTEFPCPAGTFSSSYYAISAEDCKPCPRGFFCPLNTTEETMVECPIGYYCPSGTPENTTYPCPAGTYNPSIKARKLEECLNCTPGCSCPQASESPSSCAPGHYCPEGTRYATQHPCRAGTFNSTTTMVSIYDCDPCGYGYYSSQGSPSKVDCALGTYNNFSQEATACMACPAGFKCSSLHTIDPVICSEGEYSDIGQSACTQCEVGYYCPEKGTTKSDKLSKFLCTAGMYCYSGGNGLAVYPNLDDNGCSVGKYCPAGTTAEVNCPEGTYNPSRGRASEEECLTTPAGYYTLAGYSKYNDTPCDTGHFCLNGSSSPTQYKCPAGYYRGIVAAAGPEECSLCPSGYYCLEGTTTPIDCPMGFYCPIGTVNPESCPEGTYSNDTNMFDSKSCTPCPAGLYCFQRNLTDPVDPCDEGFYCISGSKRPEPKDNITGNPCPKGGYCPQGCSSPQPCPAGKIMVIAGAKAVSQCVPCSPGHFCLGSNSPDPTGECDPGYYCGFGESVRNPAITPMGTYAPLGSQFPIACPRGTYANQEGRDNCDECDPGYFCPNVSLTLKLNCEKGYYCPSLTWFTSKSKSYDKLPCPVGKYNDQLGRASENDCKSCTGGYYCDKKGMINVGGQCSAGFYCTKEAFHQEPPSEVVSMYGPCPAGKYCGAGTANPSPCPISAYSNSTMLNNALQCLGCYEGKYCSSTGLLEPTGDCTPGYYCPVNSSIPNPQDCLKPKYCPAGSGAPIYCPTGFYQDDNNQGYCKECPKGSYCYQGTAQECPKGFYCP